MPNTTVTISVELAIEFNYTYSGADPSVGIMSGGAEDIYVVDIPGIEFVPSIEEITIFDHVTKKLVPTGQYRIKQKLRLDSDFEQRLIAAAEDQIHEAANEPDEPDYD